MCPTYLFGHNRAFYLNLSRLVVDDNVVRVRSRIRPINTPTVLNCSCCGTLTAGRALGGFSIAALKYYLLMSRSCSVKTSTMYGASFSDVRSKQKR